MHRAFIAAGPQRRGIGRAPTIGPGVNRGQRPAFGIAAQQTVSETGDADAVGPTIREQPPYGGQHHRRIELGRAISGGAQLVLLLPQRIRDSIPARVEER